MRVRVWLLRNLATDKPIHEDENSLRSESCSLRSTPRDTTIILEVLQRVLLVVQFVLTVLQRVLAVLQRVLTVQQHVLA